VRDIDFNESISNVHVGEFFNRFENENEQSRIVSNDDVDFSIDIETIKYLEIEDYDSYTFPVIRPEPNEIVEAMIFN